MTLLSNGSIMLLKYKLNNVCDADHRPANGGQVLICICRVQNSERKLCALQMLYNEKEYNDESNWFPQVLFQGE